MHCAQRRDVMQGWKGLSSAEYDTVSDTVWWWRRSEWETVWMFFVGTTDGAGVRDKPETGRKDQNSERSSVGKQRGRLGDKDTRIRSETGLGGGDGMTYLRG